MNNDEQIVLYGPNGKAIYSDKRNLAFSNIMDVGMPKAQYSNWTVEAAVRDGHGWR